MAAMKNVYELDDIVGYNADVPFVEVTEPGDIWKSYRNVIPQGNSFVLPEMVKEKPLPEIGFNS